MEVPTNSSASSSMPTPGRSGTRCIRSCGATATSHPREASDYDLVATSFANTSSRSTPFRKQSRNSNFGNSGSCTRTWAFQRTACEPARRQKQLAHRAPKVSTPFLVTNLAVSFLTFPFALVFLVFFGASFAFFFSLLFFSSSVFPFFWFRVSR